MKRDISLPIIAISLGVPFINVLNETAAAWQAGWPGHAGDNVTVPLVLPVLSTISDSSVIVMVRNTITDAEHPIPPLDKPLTSEADV